MRWRQDHFAAGETILDGKLHKYTPGQIIEMAARNGFRVMHSGSIKSGRSRRAFTCGLAGFAAER